TTVNLLYQPAPYFRFQMAWSLRHFLIHCFNLSFQAMLLHSELVDPSIVARNALFEQTRQLSLDNRTFANETVLSKFQHAIGQDSGRCFRLDGDRFAPSTLLSA